MNTHRHIFTLVILSLFTASVHAEFEAPTDAPIDRLIKNTTQFIKENPNNVQACYTLARIHYLAFAQNSATIGGFGSDTPPNVAPDWQQGHVLRKRLLNQADLTRQQLTEHAAQALTNFNKAIELDPNNALSRLGLASLLEQYVDFLKNLNDTNIPEPFRAIFLDKARQTYYIAYDFSIKEDLKLKHIPIAPMNSLVGYEAGKAFIRLAESDPNLSADEKAKLARIKTDLATLDRLPISITPIVFSFENHTSLSDLLLQGSKISFDLDGDLRTETCPWLKPTAAILVWDPHQTGKITSGRQLFGSVTWWLFFENGYHALDALDDNRDGHLTGPELKGLALWFDKNSNALSDPGEVIPIENFPIAAIATKSTTADQGSPMNTRGLTLTNGQTLPTYDWTLSIPASVIPHPK